MQDCLTLIEIRVSVLQNAAKMPFSFADAAKLPPQPSAAAPKKYVPSRVLREVTVETIATQHHSSGPCKLSRLSIKPELASLARSSLPDAF
jgi:hypothetical protein